MINRLPSWTHEKFWDGRTEKRLKIKDYFCFSILYLQKYFKDYFVFLFLIYTFKNTLNQKIKKIQVIDGMKDFNLFRVSLTVLINGNPAHATLIKDSFLSDLSETSESLCKMSLQILSKIKKFNNHFSVS